MQRRKQAKTRLARTGNKSKVIFNNMFYLVVMQFVTKIPQTDFNQSESEPLSKKLLGDSSIIIFFIDLKGSKAHRWWFLPRN